MRRPRQFPMVLGHAIALALCGAAQGDQSPEHALLIINPAEAESLWLGNYYKHARNIPESNILYMTPGAADLNSFIATNIAAVQGVLATRDLDSQIDFVIVAPTSTYYVQLPSGLITDQCFPVSRLSISSAYALRFVYPDILAGTTSALPNRYFSGSNSATTFDSNLAYLGGAASTNASARRYHVGALLGQLGPFGNTPEQLIQMIDRSVAADGTRPAGTFYFMNNTADGPRNVRSPSFNAAVTALRALGANGLVLNGELPIGRRDILGVMSGFSNVNIVGADMTLVPGSYCDHLTSYACNFENPGQTAASEWITKGASGSSGTVDEPCNYTQKFSAPRFHVLYSQGMTLGEAYFRTIQFAPFQNLFYGDPLTRAHAYIPGVNVTGVPTTPATGTITLTPVGTPTRPGAAMQRFELYVDGRLLAETGPTGQFSLDTTTLDDGWHDLRVVGYDNSPARFAGRWTGSFVTANSGRGASLSVDRTSGALTDLFTFNVDASGGNVREIRLLHNGRVVAARQGAGAIALKPRALGAGPVVIQAEALYAGGRLARSAPVTLEISTAAPGPGTRPTAFSYTRLVDPAQPFVLDLPASHDFDVSGAAYDITVAPTQSTLLGGIRSFRTYRPNPGATGSDQVTFRITTPSGSSTATVNLVYATSLPCLADFNRDGFVDFFDFDDYVSCFEGTACPPGETADFNDDGFVDFFDFDDYSLAFTQGC
jgi:uncharacterized protein (TIGR03790 family)